jgi:hypothetical protein
LRGRPGERSAQFPENRFIGRGPSTESIVHDAFSRECRNCAQTRGARSAHQTRRPRIHIRFDDLSTKGVLRNFGALH